MTSIRLPIPGSDNGDWGDILNAFLLVEHNADGTLQKDGLITGAEQAANKAQANGYASLGSDGIVPASQLPPAVQGIGQYTGVETDNGTFSVSQDNYTTIAWANITASVGSAVSWDSGDADTVYINEDGVYAINVTVRWGDQSDNTGSYRYVEIDAACGFFIQDARAALESSQQETIQNVQLTCTLHADDFIYVGLKQGGSGSFNPDVLMLVTKVSGLSS